jgi:hypothetical protein
VVDVSAGAAFIFVVIIILALCDFGSGGKGP